MPLIKQKNRKPEPAVCVLYFDFIQVFLVR
nr:MAG TPA: hypothetical protein [Caudoviricetes sp.]